ncbi:MAG TPA: D-alanyl-D-alanine carboxypeptidase/D-alanyl-D-alanine-endopeptidase [Gemmatimonadales bacterium]
MDQLLDEEPFDRALWGVAIANPSGRIVYERNGDRLFVPASNTKIVVAAVATLMLSADFRYHTSVFGAGAVTDSTLHGDIVLYGRGDPALSNRFYPAHLTVFEALADSLRARGIVRIDGDVVGDASYFDSLTIHPSWESYDLSWWYAAPVSALAFNENTVDFRITPSASGQPPLVYLEPDYGLALFTNHARTVGVDAPRTIEFHRAPGSNAIWADGDVPQDARPWSEQVSIQDGAIWAATAFKVALSNRGIAVSGRARATYDSTVYRAARAAGDLAGHDSPPLAELLEPILQLSHNWYAEMLLKTLGREFAGVGSWDSGLAVERRFLADSLGIDTASFHIADGSGLSHWNLMSPKTFVELLRFVRSRERGRAFIDALPVAGSTGTLRGRYRNRLTGRVRAKTGTIANTNTLSGYLDGPGGTWTFSIQMNNHAAHSRDAQKRIDAIVQELTR